MTYESNERYNIARRSRIDRRFDCPSHQKNHPGKRIIGIDISDEQAVAALKLGVIDDRADSFISGAKEAATVIIATPVEQTLVMLEELAHSGIEHELLITDVGSTKQKVVDYADQVLPSRYQFVGGHPMAGSHKSGGFAAKEFPFENAFYILTPVPENGQTSCGTVKKPAEGDECPFCGNVARGA